MSPKTIGTKQIVRIPARAIGGPDLRDGRLELAAEDADLAVAEGVHPGRLGVARQRGDDLEDLARQAALGDEPERRWPVLVDPQAGLVDAEQGEGFVDDVAEEPVQILAATDLGRDPSQGGRPGREVSDRRHGRILHGSLAGDDHRCGASSADGVRSAHV